MANHENGIVEEVLTFLRGAVAQEVIEQAIPDSSTVQRNSVGDIDPYYAIQFGDSTQGAVTSFLGPRGGDYIMPVYVQAISPDPVLGRELIAVIRDLMVGKSFNHTGQTMKRPGGGMFPMTTSNGATEAYQAPASFGIPFQFDSTVA